MATIGEGRPSIVITLDGSRYTWNGKRWLGPRYAVPPIRIIDRLNKLAEEQFRINDAAVHDLQELLDIAKNAQDARQLGRALALATRALEQEPTHHGAAAVACSILRAMNRPADALVIADRFVAARTGYPALLTSRAAALCDLGRWDDAAKQIQQVIAICGGRSDGEALNVRARIKAEHPELLPPSRRG